MDSPDTKPTIIKTDFIYPEIKSSDRVYGAGLVGPILRENGDWSDYLPPEEEQNIRGIESSACFIEAPQHVIATIQEEEFLEKDRNYSARFNALLAGGTPQGGDPIKGAKSIKFDGLVDDAEMPFGADIESWEDFHSFKGVNARRIKDLAQKWLSDWRVDFKIVLEKDDPIDLKYIKLNEALKRSPVAISVSAWYEKGGIYFKPEGARDNHMVEAVFLDDQNRIHVRDTYSPFSKILAPYYDCEFGLGWVVNRKVKVNWFIDLIHRLWK